MEAVKLFNQELTALYEIKPPISKAKMTSITKGAIRSIKYYKHVVQSVEKFIQKCRPEYKIPGLYVIDSIVRQSRHQFGPDKDVFAPRFAKNIQLTFYHLYKCSEEEKSRVIRVLNLWQKNEVFVSEVIQPLFDLANPISELSKQMDEQASKTGAPMPKSSGSGTKQGPGTIQVASMANMAGGSQSNQILAVDTQNIMDQPLIAQQIQQLLNSQVQQDAKKFSSNLLDDFDYSDEESSPRAQGNTGMNDKPDVPSHLLDALTMIMSTERGIQQLKQSGHVSEGQIQQLQSLLSTRQPQPVPSLAGRQISPQINIYGSTVPTGLITHDHNDLHNPFAQGHSVHQTIDMSLPPPIGGSHINPWSQLSNSQIQAPLTQHAPLIDISMDAGREDNLSDIEVIDDRDGGWNDRNSRTDKNGRRTKDKDNRRNRRSRSRSRSRSKGRERGGKRNRRERRSKSRSPYGERYRRGGRGRSESHDMRDRREDDKRDEDKRRDREKKGLPPMKKGYLSVCSTTLWVGHLSKLIAEDDLSDMFGEFGEILSINTIPPRGCAFICMNRRMDAYKALKQLHKTKLHGKQMTLAWAPGKGMKDKQWKDYWDVDMGVSYIPIDRLDPQTDMALLESGGMFDEDTMPDWMRTMRGVAPLSTNSINVPLLLQPDSILPTSPQQQVGIQTSTSIITTTAPPPGFVNIPSGAAHGLPTRQIPGLSSAPPGIPPFGLPPGLPPHGAGLLHPPAPQPGLLAGAAGLLPSPGAALAGMPSGAPPTSLILGQARFPGITGPLARPPPGFPGFDVSQPPPRMTIPPLGAQGTSGLATNSSLIHSTERDRHSSGHSVHMEIEDAVGGASVSLQKDGNGERHDIEKRGRPERETRWGGRGERRDERPGRDARENIDGHYDELGDRPGKDGREHRDERRNNRARDRHVNNDASHGIGSKEREIGNDRDNIPLISRLRDLAGLTSSQLSNEVHPLDAANFTNNPEIQNHNEWNQTSISMHQENSDRSFCEDNGIRIPPPFINQPGIPEGNGPNFSGPPPGMIPLFDNGPPHLRAGPAGTLFDGSRTSAISFPGNTAASVPGLPPPPFNEFGPGRGNAQRGGWRGRSNQPFRGRGGNRGGFRDGPQGNWSEDISHNGRGAGVAGNSARGSFRDHPPDFSGNRNRNNWDGANRHGQRGGRGRGARGSLANFNPSTTEDINHKDKDSGNSDEPSQRGPESKRERKSRWGENEENNDTLHSHPIEPHFELVNDESSEPQENNAATLVNDIQPTSNSPLNTEAIDESHMENFSRANGDANNSADQNLNQSENIISINEQNDDPESENDLTVQRVSHLDEQCDHSSPLPQPLSCASETVLLVDDAKPHTEVNGYANNVPLDTSAVNVNDVTNVIFENNFSVREQKEMPVEVEDIGVSSLSEPATKTQNENQSTEDNETD